MSEHDHNDHECAHCAALAAGMSQEEALIHGLQTTKQMIDDMGIAVIGVGSDEHGSTPFIYTIGFAKLGFPEVIVVASVDPRIITHFLNIYHAELLAGTKQPGPCVITDYITLPLGVIDVTSPEIEDFATQAFAYFEIVEEGAIVPKFVQWVLPDQFGKLPWEPGFAMGFSQHLLGEAPK